MDDHCVPDQAAELIQHNQARLSRMTSLTELLQQFCVVNTERDLGG